MARSLILVRTTLGWEDVGLVRDHVRDIKAVLKDVPGFEGGGAWQGVQDVYARLVLYAYESPEAMAQGLAAVADLPVLTERLGENAMPVDVLRLQVERSDGAFSRGIPIDAMLSASVHIAEPGYGPEAVDEFENDFGGLQMVDGYAGMVIGTRMSMTDEVVGLTAWHSATGLVASVPEVGAYPVILYEPLGEA